MGNEAPQFWPGPGWRIACNNGTSSTEHCKVHLEERKWKHHTCCWLLPRGCTLPRYSLGHDITAEHPEITWQLVGEPGFAVPRDAGCQHYPYFFHFSLQWIFSSVALLFLKKAYSNVLPNSQFPTLSQNLTVKSAETKCVLKDGILRAHLDYSFT